MCKSAKGRKAMAPDSHVTRSKTKEVISVEDTQTVSDNTDSLIKFPDGLSGMEKLQLLLTSPYLDKKYDNKRLIALYVDNENKDFPLYYIDLKRYKGKQFISNAFVSAFFFLLDKHFEGKPYRFFDISLWSSYIANPVFDVDKVAKVLDNKNISRAETILIPAFVSGNHFILFVVDITFQKVGVFDSLDRQYKKEVKLLVHCLKRLYGAGTTWKIEDHYQDSKILRQNDSHSCAFFTCLYAYHYGLTGFVENVEVNVEQKENLIISLIEGNLMF